MKTTRITTAVVSALILSAVGVSAFAQTAPATPAAPAATPAAPAATTGVPAAYANDPVVAQVNTQLTAQGFTITNVTVNAAGAYVIDAVSAAGVVRQLIVDPATGAVTDSLNQVGNGMPGEGGNEGNDSNETSDSMSNDNGSNDSNGSESGSESGVEND